ncbi:MAG: potassium channel family protein [Patescibacteria group bacterium]
MKRILHWLLSEIHEQLTGVKPPPGFIATISTLSILLIVGTAFYSSYEGWSYIDSFYFSVVTLATVGYGDLHPTTTATKLFTVAYIFIGVGLGLYIFSTLARSFIEGRDKRMKRIEKLLSIPKNESD